jgi:hypothetical protein
MILNAIGEKLKRPSKNEFKGRRTPMQILNVAISNRCGFSNKSKVFLLLRHFLSDHSVECLTNRGAQEIIRDMVDKSRPIITGS